MAKLDEIDKNTRKFSESLVDMIRTRNSDGLEQAQSMADYVMKSKSNPSRNILEEMSKSRSAELQERDERLAGYAVDSLLFESIGHREEAIPRAALKTYEWVFEKPKLSSSGADRWSNFPTWLEAPSDEIYWITGKPGAGKSTLMKFVLGQRMLGHLKKWAGTSQLLMASFYSWNAGTGLQKSHEGLLRTLLHQCVQNWLDLFSKIFPRRWALLQFWEGNELQLPSWQLPELAEGFQSLVSGPPPSSDSVSGKPYKLFFLIDGLDEFDGEHLELVKLIQETNACPRVKICASSRPWNVFRDAFKQNPKLQLENLTRDDITLYTRDHFETSEGFRELQVIHPTEADKLLNDIVQKAQGVFLWVSVVVRSLLDNLREGDKLTELQKTLDNLPDDLANLF